ncbi:MAG: RloB family protein [Floccifex sp.]
MVRKATKKKRGVATRKRKNIILLGSEGKNETERRYFNGFKPKLNQYIIMHAGGNNTDPLGVINNTVDEIDYQELDFEDGDLAYVLLDCDINKGVTNEKKLINALKKAEKNKIIPILSTPAFELWYLLHYRFTSKSFNSNQELISDLIKYIPTYNKSSEVFHTLFPKTNDAITNAIKLTEYQEVNNSELSQLQKTNTNVYQLVEILMNDINDKLS